MFGSLIWCLKVVVYVGALATIVAGAVFGPEVLHILGVANALPAVGYGLGALAGVFCAAVVFGIPIVLLSIHANLALAVQLLKTIQVAAAPSLARDLTPVLVDHALDSLLEE